MAKPIEEIVQDLFRRGHHPHGVAYVLRLLAAENEEGTKRRRRFEEEASRYENDE